MLVPTKNTASLGEARHLMGPYGGGGELKSEGWSHQAAKEVEKYDNGGGGRQQQHEGFDAGRG